MSYEEASNELQKLNLAIYKLSEVYDDSQPIGIISQTPAKGTNANQGDTIGVTVNLGQKTTVVPNVVNYQEKDAINKLKEQHLGYKVEDGYKPGYSNGAVYAQSITANAEVTEDTVITIWVCRISAEPQTSVQQQTTKQQDTSTAQQSQVKYHTVRVFTEYPNGEGGGNEYTVKHGDMFEFAAPKGNEYYSFSHWNDGSKETTRKVIITEDVDYTAYLIENSQEPTTVYQTTAATVLTVYFDANGGSVSPSSKDVKYGNTISFPT